MSACFFVQRGKNKKKKKKRKRWDDDDNVLYTFFLPI